MTSLIIKPGLAGLGVFANKVFNKGDEVFAFSNQVITIDHPPGCDCELCMRCIQVGENDWLSPEQGSYGWNLNHSCSPNCGIIKNVIVTLRKINPGEEITIDYSTTTADNAWTMTCLCHRKTCRKIIRSVQYLTPQQFKKIH